MDHERRSATCSDGRPFFVVPIPCSPPPSIPKVFSGAVDTRLRGAMPVACVICTGGTTPAQSAAVEGKTLQKQGSIMRNWFKLGMVPVVAVALALAACGDQQGSNPLTGAESGVDFARKTSTETTSGWGK